MALRRSSVRSRLAPPFTIRLQCGTIYSMDNKPNQNESKAESDYVIKEEKIYIVLDEVEQEVVKEAMRRMFDKMFGEFDEQKN